MEFGRQSDLQLVPMADGDGDDSEALPPGVSVSKFDFSVENHFKVMDEIAMCSGESQIEYQQDEIQRLSSSVTFLRCVCTCVIVAYSNCTCVCKRKYWC